MKPVRLCVLISLLCVPVTARSELVFAGWGDSPNNGAPTDQLFDCRSNTGTHDLVFSFQCPLDVPSVAVATLDVVAVGGMVGRCGDGPNPFCPPPPDVPPFWDLSSTGCHGRSVTAAAGFPADAGTGAIENPFIESMLVQHPWTMESRPGGDYLPGTHYLVGHEIVEIMPSAGSPVALQAGHEYYVATLAFKNAGSTGSGACEGCCAPLFFTARLTLDTGNGSPLILTAFPPTWQAGQSASCQPVPARAQTWGALKSLYR